MLMIMIISIHDFIVNDMHHENRFVIVLIRALLLSYLKLNPFPLSSRLGFDKTDHVTTLK